MKKATLEALIERKSKQDKEVLKNIEIKSIGLSFDVVKMPLSQMLGIMDKYDIDNGNYTEKFAMFKELVYMSIPLFRNDKLIELYNCIEPTDVVTAVLDDNLEAITELATAIMKIYGLSDGKAVASLKN